MSQKTRRLSPAMLPTLPDNARVKNRKYKPTGTAPKAQGSIGWVTMNVPYRYVASGGYWEPVFQRIPTLSGMFSAAFRAVPEPVPVRNLKTQSVISSRMTHQEFFD